VAGVVCTGSTQVAGINAMLVDSSALPEQVVDAVVMSAFQSQKSF